jgi:hypothetical protein
MKVLKYHYVYGEMTTEMARGWRIVCRFFSRTGAKELRITAIRNGSTHLPESFHSTGDAVDFEVIIDSTYDIDKLRKELGNNFDVVIEKDHIHVEYDPDKSLICHSP